MPPLNAFNTNTTQTVYSGTGTVTQPLSVCVTDDRIFICGRARISDFVRTGSNPGINITLPDGYVCNGSMTANNQIGGISGEGTNIRTRETINVYASDTAHTVTIAATESYTNVNTTGLFWLLVPPISVKIKKSIIGN